MGNILQAALEYAGRGWPVFPCNANDKRPYTRDGFKNATTDPDQIRRWWSTNPSAMIGVPTGGIGCFVIDLDPKDGRGVDDLLADIRAVMDEDLPPCPSVRTPRGGLHLYFELPEGDKVSNRAGVVPDVDIRGDGGYVIVPPSVRRGPKAVADDCDGAAYTWRPGASLDDLMPPDPPAAVVAFTQYRPNRTPPASEPPGAGRVTQGQAVQRYAANALVQESAALAAAPEGTRNDAINTAAFALGQLVAAGALQESVVRASLESVVRNWPNISKSQGTIESGLTAGKAQPRNLSEVGRRPSPTATKSGAGGGGGGEPPGRAADDPRPVIRIELGQRPAAVEAASKFLGLGNKRGPVFQRGGELVQVAPNLLRSRDGSIVAAPAITAIDAAGLRTHLARAARFEKFDGRRAGFSEIDPPRDLAEAVISARDHSVPVVSGLSAAPLVRPDGSLLNTRGFDPLTGLFLTTALDGVEVPKRPSKDDADLANELLTDFLKSFPFSGRGASGDAAQSLAAATAAVLTAIERPILPHAPGFGISAPTPGSGKSYLADVISVIATGRTAPAVGQQLDPAELEKTLIAAVLDGETLICIDNATRPIGGDFLCRFLTQERVSARILGHSKIAKISTATTLLATGNNLRIAGDLTRRVLLIHLDAELERPEARAFESQPLHEARERRPDLLSAALTLIRFGIQRRDPSPPSTALAGFETWSLLCREPLLAVGHADPVATMEVARDVDYELERETQLLAAWRAAFSDEPATVAAAIALGNEAAEDELDTPRADLRDALRAMAATRSGHINARRMGHALHALEGRPIAGLRFERRGLRSKVVLWAVAEAAS